MPDSEQGSPKTEYRRKAGTPVVAVRFLSALLPLDTRCTENSGESFEGHSIFVDKDGPHLFIRTPGRTMRVNSGDWIVTDSTGDHSLYSPESFSRLYEPVAPVADDKPEHVCGLTGFGLGRELDVCPACEKDRRTSAPSPAPPSETPR